MLTASHAHTDHLDPETLRALPGAALVAPAAHRELAAERARRDRRRAAADQRPRAGARRGRQPDRRGAAALARDIGARLAVPMHFELFAFNTEPPDAFVAACSRLGQPHRVLRAGERLTLP